MKIEARPYKMVNAIQNYEWGTRNEEAFIPKFLGIETEFDKPYAELWIGAHEKAPSKLVIDDREISLIDLINENPADLLGEEVIAKFDSKLPFLFKVLSAGEALSIQAHPSKREAEVLNNVDPVNYPDKNHKPEIAIALDNLTALVGFRSYEGICTTLKEYTELSEFIGDSIVNKFLNAKVDDCSKELRDLYSSLMINSEKETGKLKKAIKATIKRINKTKQTTEEQELIVELHKKYGFDVGLYSILLMNIKHLKKGEAVYLGTGIPHAYLKGNIVECMANSDNVVRAGLTPKFKDVSTLVHILEYDLKSIEVLGSDSTNEEVIEYDTPASEFKIKSVNIAKDKTISFENGGGLSILLISDGKISFNGDNLTYKKGEILFLPAIMNNSEIKGLDNSKIFIAEVPK